GEPRMPYSSVIEKVNRSGKLVISVDIPSGINSTIAVKPEMTVTFTDVKIPMNENNSGQIIIKDIGISKNDIFSTGPGDLLFYPYPDKESHKGMNGNLGIMGGWKFHGSAIIAAKGAHSTSPDLVKIFINNRNYQIIGSQVYSTMVIDCEENEDYIEDILKSSCILMGPGMGEDDHEMSTMARILEASNVPVVLDAAGIMLLKSRGMSSMGKDIVITPHKGEFRKLTGMEPTEANAEETARKLGVTVIIKGPQDIITDGINTITGIGGTPRMTMGGTGDLLAGIIGGLMSKGMPAMRAVS
ncbi:carbohydrate kinase, YjeF related protein, partial [mine drainage metagenome]